MKYSLFILIFYLWGCEQSANTDAARSVSIQGEGAIGNDPEIEDTNETPPKGGPAGPEEIRSFIGNELYQTNNLIRLHYSNPFGVVSLSELKAMYPEFREVPGKKLTDGTNFIEYIGMRDGYAGPEFWTQNFSFTTMPGRFSGGITDGMSPEEVLATRYPSLEDLVRRMWHDYMTGYYFVDYDFPEDSLDTFMETLLKSVEAMGAVSGDHDGHLQMDFIDGKLKVVQDIPN